LPGYDPAVKSWRLRDIATPDGSRSPVVLHSGDEGRAVLIGLDAGQELGDHQVKESAFLVMLEGSVHVSSGGEELEAEAGTLVLFDPDERHSVTAADGARILLLLAPWPGAGHYRAEEMQAADAGTAS
jgi:quercetin dioxygenase-like cupin family protein